ncbi:hypothetical protein NBRC116598_10110 [Pseudophaeobacter arcticus]|uniref:Uncharacterized protein n=1 Tax=Pseudophaeobacter arcticus TaxID=385492 RepID=A0ABQ0AI66_9RHOB
MNRLIGHLHMQGLLIRIRIDGNGFDTHLAGGLDNTAGDLAPVRDQDLFKHWQSLVLLYAEMQNAAGELWARLRRLREYLLSPEGADRSVKLEL